MKTVATIGERRDFWGNAVYSWGNAEISGGTQCTPGGMQKFPGKCRGLLGECRTFWGNAVPAKDAGDRRLGFPRASAQRTIRPVHASLMSSGRNVTPERSRKAKAMTPFWKKT